MPDILVLGATGFTGRLIVRYLANHPERSSFSLAIAARSKSKLNDLKKDLALDDSVRVLQVDVSKPAQVEEAVKSAQVVINTVGPYWWFGTEVVKACALNGRHYVDLAAETPWIRRMITKYDYVAAKNGAVIIPSCGMDSVPADLLVLLANNTLKATAGPDVGLGRSTTVYRIKGGVSGGTLSTMYTMIEEVSSSEISHAMRDFGLNAGIEGAPSPSPPLVYAVPFTSPPQYAMTYPMGRLDRAIVQRTWGLHALAAESTDARSNKQDAVVRRAYGPQFTYQECLTIDALSGFLPMLFLNMTYYLVLAAFVILPPVRKLFKRLVPQPGTGPSDKEMEKGFVEATNYTSSASVVAPELHVKTVMRGSGDPGYLLTAIMISESALALLLEKSALPPLAHAGGLLTPASALGDVLVRRLEQSGRFQFESAIFDPERREEGRKGR